MTRREDERSLYSLGKQVYKHVAEMAPPQPDEPIIDPMYEPARPDEQERFEGDEQAQAHEE